MSTLRIYTDESVPTAVAEGLRRRGLQAWSARDVEQLGLSDEEQLQYAQTECAVIFTHDDDFLRLADEWYQQEKQISGVIYAHIQKLDIGECIRRLEKYTDTIEAEDMINRVEFL